MTCITEFQLSPAVVLYNRMSLMRKGYSISFHDLDCSDISTMIEIITNMIDRKDDLGFYSLVLCVLDSSLNISSRYHSYEDSLKRLARTEKLYNWQLNGAVVLNHYQHITISLPEHRNPYRAVQVAYMLAHRTALQS